MARGFGRTSPLRLAVVAAALGLAVAPAAGSDRVDAKLQCQMQYHERPELGAACQRGVELAARTPDEATTAINECGRGFAEPASAVACQRGVAIHQRVGAGGGRAAGGDRSSTFSYSWREGRPAAQIEVGDYRLLAGDAEKSIEECMRAFEHSRTPPSCLSGFSGERKPPGPPPR